MGGSFHASTEQASVSRSIRNSRPAIGLLCRWLNGDCRFGDRCNFAHGEAELRALPGRGRGRGRGATARTNTAGRGAVALGIQEPYVRLLLLETTYEDAGKCLPVSSQVPRCVVALSVLP
jgi:hypothetical protein